MKYRIEYSDGRPCEIVCSSEKLVKRLRCIEGAVDDIRKLYKGGASDSVLEIYLKYVEER